jgi:hypothetical protein
MSLVTISNQLVLVAERARLAREDMKPGQNLFRQTFIDLSMNESHEGEYSDL